MQSPPKAPTSEPTVHAQATATTVGSGQPMADSADHADPTLPLEHAVSATTKAAQPLTGDSHLEGGHLAPWTGPPIMWL